MEAVGLQGHATRMEASTMTCVTCRHEFDALPGMKRCAECAAKIIRHLYPEARLDALRKRAEREAEKLQRRAMRAEVLR